MIRAKGVKSDMEIEWSKGHIQSWTDTSLCQYEDCKLI